MVKKKKKSSPKKKKSSTKKHKLKKVKPIIVKPKKKSEVNPKKLPTLNIKSEQDIAMDFATKTYQKFQKIVKSIILFGSTIKHTAVAGSDVDIIIIIDDVSINWDQTLVAWYREELDKILRGNPYKKTLHINTVKLSTWWQDVMKGDPVVVNVLRYGEALIDYGGFFDPLKHLLIKGKIKSTPEAIYSCLQRAPIHFARSKAAELNSIEGLYWAMVDSAHAALIAANVVPPSPEHIPINLKETFVDSGKLKIDYVKYYRDLHMLHRKIAHGDTTDLKGVEIDQWQEITEDFIQTMTRLVKEIIS